MRKEVKNMAEDGVMPQLTEKEIMRRKDELLVKFCEERGIDPTKIDATQLSTFCEQEDVKALLAVQYRRK